MLSVVVFKLLGQFKSMPQVRVIIRGRNKPVAKTVKSRSAVVEGILAEMCINPQEVLVRLNGEFVPDSQRVRRGDRLELIEITSRG
jgi:sulfur carrier protein ThiS